MMIRRVLVPGTTEATGIADRSKSYHLDEDLL